MASQRLAASCKDRNTLPSGEIEQTAHVRGASFHVSQSIDHRDAVDRDARLRKQQRDGHDVVGAGIGIDENRVGRPGADSNR